MKYKNITKKVLKFRAHDSKGIVKIFELKPDDEMESDREVTWPGLEKIGTEEPKKIKKKEGDK